MVKRISRLQVALTIAAGILPMGLVALGLTIPVAALGGLILATLALLAPSPEHEAREASDTRRFPDQSNSVDIEAFADPVLTVDPTSRIEGANKSARALLGEHIVGGDLRIALRHPAALDAARGALGGEPVEREVAGIGRTEGLFRLRATHLGRGRLLLVFSDISKLRMAERMRVDFVANASHELRTPLATILGFIETLQGPAAEDAPARLRFLDIMRREAGRMTRLIDDLLSLSRIELDKYVRPQAPLDLSPLFEDVGRTLAMRLEADQRGLTIEAPESLPRVFGDRDQVLQVLHNLVSNALKYGRSGTPIRLTAAIAEERGEQVVRVAVADEGEGIPPEHLPRLTERFYRVDNSRSRAMGGTGLGLAIVKHIVERHRGTLLVESRLSVGTTVSFTLPTVSEAMSQN